MSFPIVVGTELMKLRRSKVTWISLAACTFMVGMAGFFMWMMLNPGMARSLGLLGQKAGFAFGGQSLDWPTFLTFIVEMGGIGGLVICSIVFAYIFGREYTEGTAKNMLALPIARSRFVFAKIIVGAAWFAVLTLWMIVETYLVGSMLGITGLTAAMFLAAAVKLLVLALMSLCCAALVAWVAVETRGYFAPLGFSIFTLALASVFGHTGWGPWAPWSIIGIYSGAAGPDAALGGGSFVVIAATFLAGTALTIQHEVRADNVQ
jgi:ABC-type transport system involved in multi-copper enzyme maturation permease subunit